MAFDVRLSHGCMFLSQHMVKADKLSRGDDVLMKQLYITLVEVWTKKLKVVRWLQPIPDSFKLDTRRNSLGNS